MSDIATLGIRIESAEAEVATARLDKLAASGGKAEQATKGTTAATTGYTSAARQMTEAINAQTMAETKAAAATVGLGSSVRAVTATYADFYTVAQKDYSVAWAAAGARVANTNKKVSDSTKLAGHEVANLGRQFSDIGVSAAMGMNPLMILIQQGPQIADVFATAAARGVSFKAALAGVVAEMAPLAGIIAIFAAVAAAVGLVVFAGISYGNQVKEAESATAGLGKAAGLTGSDLMALADASAKAGDISAQAARKGAEAYVHAGIASHDVISGLVELQRQYAFATGQDAATANAELAKSFADLTTGVGTLDDRLNFLDGTTKEHILDLAKQSDQTYAQMEALKALQGELDRTTAALDRQKGGWDGLKRAAMGFFDAVGQTVNPGLDTRIANLKDQIESLSKISKSSYQLRYAQAQLQALESQKGIAEMVAAGNAQRGAENTASKAALANYKALVPIETQRVDLQKRLNDARADAKAGRITQAQLDKAEIAAKQQLAALDRKEAGPKGPKDPAIARGERLSRENDAIEATIKGNYDLAAAYKTSDAAAMHQADVTKATAAAIKDRGDVETYIARQIKLTASEQAVAGAQTVADLTAQTKARRAAYADVAAGKITMAEANQQIANELALRKLNAAYANAEGDAKIALKGIIDDLTAKQKEANAAAREAAQLQVLAGQSDNLAYLRAEADLIGVGNRERAIKLAQLQAEQDEKNRGYNAATASHTEYTQHNKIIAGAKAAAAATYDLQKAQDEYNASLERGANYMGDLASEASDAASAISDAFDGAGDSIKRVVKGIGDLMKIMSAQAALQAKVDGERKRLADDSATTITDMADFETKAYRESSLARIQSYGDMAAAGKSFFAENTGGYKAMQAAEIGFRTVQMLMSIKAMGMQAAETGVHLTQSGIRAAASGVEAFARTLASLPFPFNLAAGATVLAALASVGVAVSGGGGSAPGANDAQHRQDAQGAGSVLGDAKAKTESIVNSLALVADHTNHMLEFYNPMLAALKSIDDQIGTVAAALAKSLGVGGMLDTSKLGLGSSVSGPGGLTKLFSPIANLLPGLFGTSTKKTLQDQGLQFSSGSLASILSGGIQGKTYQQILTESTSKFFGLTVGQSASKKTTTGALDPEFAKQTTLLLGSLREGVLSAASVLGIEGAAATLDAFKIDLGKISLKDLKGDEITKALEAVFGKVADGMAAAVLPGLDAFQKVGEGAFETLTRLARDYQVVDVTLSSIGKTFSLVGVASLTAREHLVGLFDSLDAFQSATAFYADNFLTEAEKLAPIQSAVTHELARLGLAGVTTRDQFKAVVQGLDLSTAAGADLFAALMNLAPAFAAVTEETKAIADAKDRLSAAYDRESGALENTRDKMRDLAAGLADFGKTLIAGPAAALTPEARYAAAQAEFARVNGLAQGGDQTALGDLQNVSQEYLDASKAYYASSAGYFADLAAVRDAVTSAEGLAGNQADLAQQQLDAMTAQVGQLVDLNTNVITVAQAIAELTALLAGTPYQGQAAALTAVATGATTASANDNTAVVTELQAIRTAVETSNQLTSEVAVETIKRLTALENRVGTLVRVNEATA